MRRETGKDLHLQDIKFCVNMTGTVVGLAEKGGRNVAAARKKKVCGGVCLPGIQTDKAGYTQLFYGVFIVLCVSGTAGDEYGGSCHGGFLPEARCFILILCRFR